jgi:hypothetical protein
VDFNNYKKIFTICKKVLNKNKNSLYISSINELHLIRPHPIFLNNYKSLFQKNFYIKVLFLYFFNVFKLMIYIFFNFFKKRKKIKKKININNVFFSHFLNSKDEKKEIDKDIYFSHIIKNIDQKRSVLVAINHTKKNYENFKNKVILDTNIKFFLELKIFYQLIINSLYLIKYSIFSDSKNYKKFYFFLFSKCASINTFKNVLVYYQAKEIIKLLNPKKVIVTFEGHAFERNIFLAAKKTNIKIETIGFHHSIPFKNQFAYTLNLKNNSNPDIIFASGKSSFTKFSKNKNFKKTILIGSNRISKSKFKIQNKLNKSKLLNSKYCLVIPEGIESEACLLLNFCNDYLLKFDNVKFIIRLHPLLSGKIKRFQALFDTKFINKKVFFSNNKNQSYDIKRCDVAFYRGTSLIFDAVKSGLVPLYYSRKNEINFDPLLISQNQNKRSIKILDIYQFNKIINNKNIFKKNYYFEAYSYPNQRKIAKYFK